MSAQTGQTPVPPDGLRPAQLGVVLIGRVLLGHIGATLVDLASRGVLDIQTPADDGSSWLLTIANPEAENLLGYEQALLYGLFDERPSIPLDHMAVWAIPILEKARSEIVHDALNRGWLRAGLKRRFAVTRRQRGRQQQKPGKRTEAGEKLLRDINVFKRQLRSLASAEDTATLARFASYAMILGLAAPMPMAMGSTAKVTDPPVLTSAFASSWVEACQTVGESDPKRRFDPMWQSNTSPYYVSPYGHGHGQGHGDYPGYGGDHGGFDAGHGGFGGHG